jgi:hypothetical protein
MSEFTTSATNLRFISHERNGQNNLAIPTRRNFITQGLQNISPRFPYDARSSGVGENITFHPTGTSTEPSVPLSFIALSY